jgi:hypothetical protein
MDCDASSGLSVSSAVESFNSSKTGVEVNFFLTDWVFFLLLQGDRSPCCMGNKDIFAGTEDMNKVQMGSISFFPFLYHFSLILDVFYC